jgi:hypothetical protein
VKAPQVQEITDSFFSGGLKWASEKMGGVTKKPSMAQLDDKKVGSVTTQKVEEHIDDKALLDEGIFLLI